MKKITLLFVAIIFWVNGFAQVPSWIWARAAAGPGGQQGRGIATDAIGNLFITGYFTGTSITFGSYTLTNTGLYGIYVVKYDAAGNVLWARSAGGGSGMDFVSGISTDASGNAFITGSFSSSSITFGSYTLTNSGAQQVFVVKYDAAGNVVWARSSIGTGSDGESKSITVDPNGNVFVTGSFNPPSILFGSCFLMSWANQNIFVVKYDAAGNAVWARSTGSTGSCDSEGNGISADASGNVMVTGNYASALYVLFGNDSLPNTVGYDIFIVKYDSSGNVVWARGAGGIDHDDGRAIAVDASGNAFVTGSFRSPSITFGSTTLTNAGDYDIFVAKYDALGNVVWGAGAGGIGPEMGYSVSADTNGNIYVTGPFNSASLSFGSIIIAPPSIFYDPLFIVKYNSSGNALCASALASGGNNCIFDWNAVSTDRFGNAYLTGDFLYLNPFIVGSDTLILTGVENVFTAKWTCGESTSISNISASNTINYISIFPNPATSELRIENAELRIREIEIYNTLEEKRLTPTLSKGEGVRVDVSSLPAGVYFVAVTDDKGNKITKRFVKM